MLNVENVLVVRLSAARRLNALAFAPFGVRLYSFTRVGLRLALTSYLQHPRIARARVKNITLSILFLLTYSLPQSPTLSEICTLRDATR